MMEGFVVGLRVTPKDAGWKAVPVLAEYAKRKLMAVDESFIVLAVLINAVVQAGENMYYVNDSPSNLVVELQVVARKDFFVTQVVLR